MASFVTGQRFARVMADIGTVVPGRNAHDYAGILFRLDNGAPGVMWVTQAGAGAVHGLHFRVFGEKGGLEWFQEEPNRALPLPSRRAELIYERGGPGLKPEALRAQRIGIGHPEGYQEAFAVLYADAAEAIVARKLGEPARPPRPRLPHRRGRRPHDEVHRRGAGIRRAPAPGSTARLSAVVAIARSIGIFTRAAPRNRTFGEFAFTPVSGRTIVSP